ncbi:M10 family metallopeptidase C-terminal domain-containing protein [Microvirga zambiensis]|uniref:M10 family metallopeptidase C-terminal domain-containing protein n=1 Tax=Microvirga zambiensis TaxID=1402137 RepID=UPI00191E3B3E|nr:M10 family metallopeptidase C-terminal domain-containing protein [Microvirga zambiensis]
MAYPTWQLFPYTADAAVDAITNGSYWVMDGTRTLTWGVSHGFQGETWADPTAIAQVAYEVLNTFSQYANIGFRFNGYYADPSASYYSGSDLNISLSGSSAIFSDPSGWAIGGFPSTQMEMHTGGAGDVFLNVNSEAVRLPSYAAGSQGWFLLLHEFGHALGLKHTHDGGGTGRPTLQYLGIPNWDKDWFSVMSYEDDYQLNFTEFDPATPMALDVIGLQALYGINRRTNAGDSTYNLSVDSLYQTIWDAGGRDTVTAQGSSEGWRIVLPYWQFSNIVTEKFGWALPVADVGTSSPRTMVWLEGNMEYVRGSNFADEIFGNQLSNTLRGYDGDDYINGGAGNDVLYGGAGMDLFVFHTKPSKSANRDRISDFNVHDDAIWLDNAMFKKLGSAGDSSDPAQLKSGHFRLTKARDSNDYIIYNKKTGVLSYDVDGSGSKAAVEFALVSKNLNLTYKDLFVV